MSEPEFGYSFPALRGIQANREYYVSMCPLRLIPKIFLFDEEELVPEIRAQRILNKARVPELGRYILDNRDSYVFSALTASIDGDVRFQPIGESREGKRIGVLHVPMDARFIINDGQHRRAAIELAIRENPDLADETIAIVFFLDIGLERCQQMFADLNRYAIRPSKSLGVLYDHRDDLARLTRLVVLSSDFYSPIVELERSTLSARSRKLLTLSAIYHATSALLNDLKPKSKEEAAQLASGFWEELARQFPDWQAVRQQKMSAGELRRDYIHSHGVVLQAFGRVGNCLLPLKHKAGLKSKLRSLRELDWRRSNASLWEGRAMTGGRVTKGGQSVVLTTNVIKQHLGLELTPEEQRAERAYRGGKDGSTEEDPVLEIRTVKPQRRNQRRKKRNTRTVSRR